MQGPVDQRPKECRCDANGGPVEGVLGSWETRSGWLKPSQVWLLIPRRRNTEREQKARKATEAEVGQRKVDGTATDGMRLLNCSGEDLSARGVSECRRGRRGVDCFRGFFCLCMLRLRVNADVKIPRFVRFLFSPLAGVHGLGCRAGPNKCLWSCKCKRCVDVSRVGALPPILTKPGNQPPLGPCLIQCQSSRSCVACAQSPGLSTVSNVSAQTTLRGRTI
jgi:hypothetical protein